MTETAQIQEAYWEQFLRFVGDHSRILKHRRTIRHWMEFDIGTADMHLTASTNLPDQWVGVQLVLEGDAGAQRFQRLLEAREQIDAEIGQPLTWGLPSGVTKISLRWHHCDPSDRTQWNEQHAWLLAYCERFYRVFAPRLNQVSE